MTRPRRLAIPRRAAVRATVSGRPVAVEGDPVESVRETWLVEDGWWTPHPVRRRYWEVVTASGRDVVVFHELERGGWFRQR